jgi:hypothetical protein
MGWSESEERWIWLGKYEYHLTPYVEKLINYDRQCKLRKVKDSRIAGLSFVLDHD